MTPPAKYTERQLIEAKREAFVAGADWCFHDCHTTRALSITSRPRWIAAAKSLFELPKVTRPRVVKDAEGVSWRVSGDTVQWSVGKGCDWAPRDWAPLSNSHIWLTVERVHLLADLLANPTEEVDDEQQE